MKQETFEFLKLQKTLYNILPIHEIMSNNKVHLFYDQNQEVNYSLCTDGDIEHLSTWIDKHPSDRDSFLECCTKLKRFDFQVIDASILLLEKRHQDRVVRNLYIDEEKLYNIIYSRVYQISINTRENITVKRMEKMRWKLRE